MVQGRGLDRLLSTFAARLKDVLIPSLSIVEQPRFFTDSLPR